MQYHRFRCLVLVSFALAIIAGLGTRISASSTPPPVKMINSNPVLEMIVDGANVKLILTTDLDGIVVCEDANSLRREWLMNDSEFDNARQRLHYELHWVSPDVRECEVQALALGYNGRINVGFFKLDNQEMRMAAVAYYLGSLSADGFIGAGFAFHLDQSPLWETLQDTPTSYGYMYHGRTHAEKKGSVLADSSEIKLAENTGETENFDRDDYVWSESLVWLGDGSDGVSNAQGISFPIHDMSFDCNAPSESVSATELVADVRTQSIKLFGDFSSSWDVVVDFNIPCLQLPMEFYDALTGWLGLRVEKKLGLSEVAFPASALPDLHFSLSIKGMHLALPLKSLALPELSESSVNASNSTKVCIQRSASMLQRGTAAFAASTTTAAEVARLQRLHGVSEIPVYNMIDSPITFGAMVLDALGPVVFDGITKRIGIRKPTSSSSSDKSKPQSLTTCMQQISCTGQQEYVKHLNVCQDPDCARYYFHSLDEDAKRCVIGRNWTVMLIVMTALFVTAELFFSLSLRRLVFKV